MTLDLAMMSWIGHQSQEERNRFDFMNIKKIMHQVNDHLSSVLLQTLLSRSQPLSGLLLTMLSWINFLPPT